MKKKIIYIIIESVKRELNSKTLLALKALKKNYRVLIGQKGALREVIKDTNPGIMILKTKILLALKALKRNYRVVIGQKGGLRQLIYDTHPGIMILKSFGPKNTKHIDFIKKKNSK